MNWTPLIRDFISQHINEDTAELLFAAKRYPDVDVAFAAEQIEARKRLKTKLPEWYSNPDLIMGGRVPAEQCSSEQTARYKRGLVCTLHDGSAAESLCDLTGGMGVDFWYMSKDMKRAFYVERQQHLCEAARHNFAHLAGGCPSIEIIHADGEEISIPSVDIIYLDPARRASDGSRVYAIEDCEPNVISWQSELLAHAKVVLVKLSPMVDITDALRKLHNVTDVYVVAVKNECKEVLVKMQHEASSDVMFHCVDFPDEKEYVFSSDAASEWQVRVGSLGEYLYEPDVTLMKAQAFKSLCHDFPVRQLDYDTRLMTSDEHIDAFPGRLFHIKEVIPFSSKVQKRLKSRFPKANIAVRNFPLSADELRKRTGIKDGGDVYLFGAKAFDIGNVLLVCSKCK